MIFHDSQSMLNSWPNSPLPNQNKAIRLKDSKITQEHHQPDSQLQPLSRQDQAGRHPETSRRPPTNSLPGTSSKPLTNSQYRASKLPEANRQQLLRLQQPMSRMRNQGKRNSEGV